MSLFSSIAHLGTTKARGIPLKNLAAFALALALGAAIGAAVVDGGESDASEVSAAAATGLSHDEFIRLNTTDMDHLPPSASVNVVEPQPMVDPFIYWNTTALDNLVPAAPTGTADSGNVSEEFLRWNVDSLQYPARKYIEQPNGPR